jgi:hypothetical protein
MIFEWSRESGAWELLADNGALLGRAWSLGGGLYQAETTPLVGPLMTATATSLTTVRDWLMARARGFEP